MINDNQIMIVGGSGLLGTELKKLYPNAYCPVSDDWDITVDYYNSLTSLEAEARKIKLIIHCAAKTDTSKCEEEKFNAFNINVLGSFNVTCLAARLNAKLVYISTDYVFDGLKGLRDPNSRVKPFNYYGETKLAGEYAVKALPKEQYLILRGSFSPEIWPFEGAYVNWYTTKVTVRYFVELVKFAIDKNYNGVQHIAGVRQTIYEYAQTLNPEVKPVNFDKIHKYPLYLDHSLIGTV